LRGVGADGGLQHEVSVEESARATVAVSCAEHDFTEFGSMTKIIESSLGGFGPVRFDQLESDTSNNKSGGDLNWAPRMSKG
jgi:hypothetical protein